MCRRIAQFSSFAIWEAELGAQCVYSGRLPQPSVVLHGQQGDKRNIPEGSFHSYSRHC